MSDYLEYGVKASSLELLEIIDHICATNEQSDKCPTPVCIWGTHGLGKTELVRDYARAKNWKFCYVAPAQFEEMGDLHGMPTILDPDPNKAGDETTVFSPPDWVPTEEGPGILLLDDMNRADDRILRGCMQLLQNLELASWKLPPKWQIVVTANPDGGDYSVTPMDGAMLTRMLHVTMKFEVKAWAAWASAAGMDERFISFVLMYPEIVKGERTTPRSLTQFFRQIAGIEDLKAKRGLVYALGMSALDESAVSAFMQYVEGDMTELLAPSDLLDAESFEAVRERLLQLAIHSDRAGIFCTRLFLHLSKADYKPAAAHNGNLQSFLLMEEMPTDLLMSLYMDLTNRASTAVKKMLQTKELAGKMLNAM